MQAVILAGGLGTRLGEVTKTMPKAMVPVLNKPFMERQIAMLRENGIEDYVILVAHMADQITDHFGDGSKFGVRIRYSNEGEKLLDTAGAIRHALPLLQDSFFLTFGDSYLNLPYRRIWNDFQATDRQALMVVYRNDNQFDTSDIAVDGDTVTAYQKSPPLPGASYINHGLMILRRDCIVALPPGERISLQQFFQPIVAQGQLMAWETSERFYEIGSPSGLAELESVLTSTAP
jgi:NDP-sugar pyrophosphorylase family protein